MMQRLLPWAVPLLFAFTALSPAQTARLRWETLYQGSTYSTATPKGVPFSNQFNPEGYKNMGGPAFWRGDGIMCAWAVAGTTDGGVNDVIVDIVHEDGGVDCSCDLGGCGLSVPALQRCQCASPFETIVGSQYFVVIDAASQCPAHPAQMHCSVDLFR